MRLERRLASSEGPPVKLLVAPPGSGKTTLALLLLAQAPLGAYCAMPRHASTQAFVEALCAAIGTAAVGSFGEFLVRLKAAAVAPLELVVDDIHRGGEDARALLSSLVEELPENVSLICATRSREAVDAKQWIARGFASFTDARRLAFDASEVAALCDACGVSYSHPDIARLLDESDGWPVVVSGAVRAAAEDERSLSEAYERWRSRLGQMFLEFVLAEADDARPEDIARLKSLIAGGALDPSALQRLETQGLFVYNDNGAPHPYKPLQHTRSAPIHVETSIPMVVRMLGRFSAAIHNRDIEWVRKRDQQIVKFLLLRKGASATRAELAEMFWPRVEKQLAAQSVRTACSNIRKAIASVVGYDRVENYFRAGTTISVDLSNVVTDVGRFTAHASAGDAAYEAGNVEEAIAHYKAAEKIYAGRLYDEDAVEQWFAKAASELEDRLGTILERLAEDAYAKGDLKHAAEFAYRAKLIRPAQPGVIGLLSRLNGDQYSA